MAKKRETDYNVFQKFVEEMVDTKTIVTNTGVFEYKGKSYILIAEVKEINFKTKKSSNTDSNSSKKKREGRSPVVQFHLDRKWVQLPIASQDFPYLFIPIFCSRKKLH